MSSDGSRRAGTVWRRRNASARRRGRGRGRKKTPRTSSLSRFAALVVDNGSGLSVAGFAVLVLLTLYFPSFVGKTPSLGIMDGTDQKERYVAPCRKLRKFRSCSSSRS